MLDVFAMIEGYCHLLIERVNLLEKERVCPDELEEVVSSLIYASTRCGEFPELQEMRAIFIARFGKEFAARAIELRNNCGVNLKMIQKLSTRQPSLESKLKLLKEIASENGIALQNEEGSSRMTQEKLDVESERKQPKLDPPMNSGVTTLKDNSPILPEDIEKVEGFSESMKGRKKFRDVADAAQAAFESAAYAAAAARAAVELSRSESHDPDDQNSPDSRSQLSRMSIRYGQKKVLNTHDSKLPNGQGLNGQGFENSQTIQNYHSVSEDEEVNIVNKTEGSKQNKNAAQFSRSVSGSSSDSADNIPKGSTFFPDVEGQTTEFGKAIVFDGSDDENGNEQGGISLSRTHDSDYDMKHSLLTKRISASDSTDTVKDEDISEANDSTAYYPSHKQYPLRSQAASKLELGHANPKLYSAEGSTTKSSLHLNLENRPMSVRTK